jgi:hypothetical protein
LPDELIVQHYADAMAHRPYSNGEQGGDGKAAAAAPPVDPPPSYDLKEYAPGTVLPTPAATGCGLPHCTEQPTQGVRLSPLAQLRSFPLARYQPPKAGKYELQRLGNVMNSAYHCRLTSMATEILN